MSGLLILQGQNHHQ